MLHCTFILALWKRKTSILTKCWNIFVFYATTNWTTMERLLKIWQNYTLMSTFAVLICTDWPSFYLKARITRSTLERNCRITSNIAICSDFLTKMQKIDKLLYSTSKLSILNISCSVENPVWFRIQRYLLCTATSWYQINCHVTGRLRADCNLKWQSFPNQILELREVESI